MEETEKTLKKHQKFNELIILYNTRGLHRKALTLMNDHLGKDDSPLGSYKKITDYLQNLSPEQVNCQYDHYKVFRLICLKISLRKNQEIDTYLIDNCVVK